MSNIISSKKLETNKRNALKSTGPKTKEAKAYERKQALQKEKERIKRNEEAFAREKRYIYFCNPYEPINKNRLGHSKIIKKKKNYNYYWLLKWVVYIENTKYNYLFRCDCLVTFRSFLSSKHSSNK